MIMRMGWDSKIFAAAAIDGGSAAPEAARDHRTRLVSYSPALPEAGGSRQENAIWKRDSDEEERPMACLQICSFERMTWLVFSVLFPRF